MLKKRIENTIICKSIDPVPTSDFHWLRVVKLLHISLQKIHS